MKRTASVTGVGLLLVFLGIALVEKRPLWAAIAIGVALLLFAFTDDGDRLSRYDDAWEDTTCD